jgi:hypothetical protein
MTERDPVTINDLAFAVEWLEAYEGEAVEELGPVLRVAAWLRSEIARREERQAISKIAREARVSKAEARTRLRRILAARAA